MTCTDRQWRTHTNHVDGESVPGKIQESLILSYVDLGLCHNGNNVQLVVNTAVCAVRFVYICSHQGL